MSKPLFLATCLTVTAFLSAVHAQSKLTEHTFKLDDPKNSAKAKIEAVQWLRGEWTGQGFDGTLDETWGEVRAGSMLGTFRLVKDNKVAFTEFFMLSEVDGTLTLRLKHFGSDMVGWERQDKFVEFRLVKVEGKTAWFDGLTYQKNKSGGLTVHLAMKQKDGGFKEVKLEFAASSKMPTAAK